MARPVSPTDAAAAAVDSSFSAERFPAMAGSKCEVAVEGSETALFRYHKSSTLGLIFDFAWSWPCVLRACHDAVVLYKLYK